MIADKNRGLRLKRCVDFFLASVCFVFTLPIMVSISLVILISSGRPVLFKQLRPGLNGKPFKLIKFRTMAEDAAHWGAGLPERKRITRIGRLLRTTSLDELPELFNIIKGDMSFVGPRPLLVSYLNRYSPRQFSRHNVKPGLTGWAQINGRNTLTWEQKFEFDIWYVNNFSLRLDMKILLKTLKAVVAREGINHPGEATMPEFMGSTITSQQSKVERADSRRPLQYTCEAVLRVGRLSAC